jgi:hypothetical protein
VDRAVVGGVGRAVRPVRVRAGMALVVLVDAMEVAAGARALGAAVGARGARRASGDRASASSAS